MNTTRPQNRGSDGPAQASAWEQARAYGVGMSLLEANLSRTPLERIRAHARALATASALRDAMGKHRAGS